MSSDNNSENFIQSKIISGTPLAEDKEYYSLISGDGMCSKTTFNNLSTYSVVVCFRDGTHSILPPAKRPPYRNQIVIGHGKTHFDQPIETLRGTEDETLAMLRERLVKSNNRSVYWEEVIDMDLIKDSRHGVYLRHADVTMVLDERYSFRSHHPFAIQRTHNLYLNLEEDFDPMHDVSISIRAIDNTGMQRSLYAIVNDRILIVKPKQSNTLRDGVYIAGLVSLESKTSNSLRRDDYYSFKEVLTGVSPIRFFDNLTEAREAMSDLKELELKDKAAQREHDHYIQSLKRDKERLAHENELLKQNQIREKQRLEEVEHRSRLEQEKLKLEMEARIQKIKEEAAVRAAAHKRWTEIAKTLGVVLTVSFAAYKMIKK